MPFPIACFGCALVTDIVYWRTADIMWADFSAWLLTVGLIFGVLAAIAGWSTSWGTAWCAPRGRLGRT